MFGRKFVYLHINCDKMKINGNILVAECTAYDYKEALERKKTKS